MTEIDRNIFAPRKGMGADEIETTITAVLTAATLAEKAGMMSGRGFFAAFAASGQVWAADPYRAGGGIARLGLGPFWFTDGPRGVARGQSTCFPCTMARGASFDADLEHRIGHVMGIEARAQACNLSGAVCVNLLRHPGWGRAQETYGEDPCHLGLMGAALGTGIQAHNVAATVKHLAVNSIENVRFTVDVRIDERTLHEIYLPHFKHIVDAGIMTVMSAYNRMNGVYCGENRVLLTDILRDEWGFEGFVHSDWIMGVYTLDGAVAGLDVENPEPRVFGDNLIAAVEEGRIAPAVVDTACRRILRVWYRLAGADDPQAYDMGLVAQDSHRTLAREAAEKSAVLLTNDGVLPLDAAATGTLAVFGRLAALENTGDFGSSRVRAPGVVTPIAGLAAYLAAHGGSVVPASEVDLDAAVHVAKQADAIVVVVGTTAREEGEYIPGDLTLGVAATDASPNERLPGGGDRATLDLPGDQIALIETAVASGKPVIVIIVAGSAVMVERWHDRPNAILQTFYAGMEGGTALARLVFGDVSPSGRLPFTVARDAADYPSFDRAATTIDYGYWHGYAKFAEEELQARYPFGHGLSYASFSYLNPEIARTGETIGISIDVRNDGSVAAEHVVLCFVAFPGTIRPRAKSALKAFARVALQPGETRRVALTIAIDTLRYRDIATHGWALETGRHEIILAHTAEGPPLASMEIDL